MMKKQAVVLHSGGMDSSICLALAISHYSPEEVLSLSIFYGQRHANELQQAEKIAKHWGVEHMKLSFDCYSQITKNALLDHEEKISHPKGEAPNTLVVGRNALMTYIAAIQAGSIGAKRVYLGILEREDSNSGYRDCSRSYINLLEQLLRIDLSQPDFELMTPLVTMTKKETLVLARRLGVLDYLLEETVSCYEGIQKQGCGQCPACHLRQKGLQELTVHG